MTIGRALTKIPTLAGAIGTALFASVRADGGKRPMYPVDDLESLVYTLAYLAAGTLPWEGQPDTIACSMKRQLLEGDGSGRELTDGVRCEVAAAVLRKLWAEVTRCHGVEGSAAGTVDYQACFAALGGGGTGADVDADADAISDAISEVTFMAALGSGTAAEEAEAVAAGSEQLALNT